MYMFQHIRIAPHSGGFFPRHGHIDMNSYNDLLAILHLDGCIRYLSICQAVCL